jgi:hypothetical protein
MFQENFEEAMGANANFVLKWNEFHSNFTNSFSDLRDDEDLLDVTIAVDEENQLQAHKVILAASSSYFKGIFKRNTSRHPVLIMPAEVNIQDLASLLDFIYHGEVTVPNDALPNLLHLAKLLKIKGLVDEESTSPHAQGSSQRGRGRGSRGGKRRPGHDEGQSAKRSKQPKTNPNAYDAYGVDEYGNPTEYMRPPNESSLGQDYAMMQPDQSGLQDQQQLQGQQPPQPAPEPTRLVALQCPQCPARCPGVDAFKEHMATVHGKGTVPGVGQDEPDPVKCDICDKSFKTHKNMMGHRKRIHKIGVDPAEIGEDGEKKRGRPKKKLEHEPEHLYEHPTHPKGISMDAQVCNEVTLKSRS